MTLGIKLAAAVLKLHGEIPEKVVPAKLVSRKGEDAQVVVLVGEGSKRRSVSCHVHMVEDGVWVGRNPDRLNPALVRFQF